MVLVLFYTNIQNNIRNIKITFKLESFGGLKNRKLLFRIDSVYCTPGSCMFFFTFFTFRYKCKKLKIETHPR